MKWADKRYYSYDYFLKQKFGEKVAKIPVSIDVTCPNRDGSKGTGGCIFCASGSGDENFGTVKKQYETKKQNMTKWSSNKYIIYFQSYTNTYGDLKQLEKIFFEALKLEGVVGLSIGTRCDCINEEVVEMFKKLAEQTFLTVEIGLQSSSDETKKLINSCFVNDDYVKSMNMLKKLNIHIVTHIILGLPNESYNKMIESVDFAVKQGTNGVKLQLLHVLKGTKLEKLYNEKFFDTLSLEIYINLLVDILGKLPKDIVVHRLTGDGDKNLLIAPLYSKNKKAILNGVSKKLKEIDSYQSKFFV